MAWKDKRVNGKAYGYSKEIEASSQSTTKKRFLDIKKEFPKEPRLKH